MSALGWGVILVGVACVLLAYAVVADPDARVSRGRRMADAAPTEPLAGILYRGATSRVDRLMKSRGWVPFRLSELEAGDVQTPPSVLLTWVVGGSIVGVLLGTVVAGSLLLGVMLGLAVPVVAKVVLRSRVKRRQKAFAKELDNTLRIISSALRAGQSLPMALASVAADSNGPMGEEVTRVINENRIGRDLVEAMYDAAERMKSEDFAWFAGAVEVQRDAGGNLNDIIETVAETIRGRAELREKIRAYASEGKASAFVLMALPVALGGVYSVMNPGYLDPLFQTGLGLALLAVSGLLYVISYFWMSAIVNIKV